MEMNFFGLDQRLERLREHWGVAPASVVAEFDEKLDVSWIYHDNALEGVVLSYHELKAAIDKNIISDVSLIPMYEEIKNQKAAISWVRDYARQLAAAAKAKAKKPGAKVEGGGITVELLKQLYLMLTPEEAAKGAPYRKDNPLHRTYFHEIATPDKIAPRMKKLAEWLDEEETQHLHPVDRAARAHQKFMAIFPWTKNSGKVARLVQNLMLMRDGYPPAVIHSIDRQRYYDVLKSEAAGLIPLVNESLHNGIDTAIRFYDELEKTEKAAAPARRQKKAS